MSYDTTYIANFLPPADISRHIGLAGRNFRQFLCRPHVFRARLEIPYNTVHNHHNNNKSNNKKQHHRPQDDVCLRTPTSMVVALAKALVRELICFRRAVKMSTLYQPSVDPAPSVGIGWLRWRQRWRRGGGRGKSVNFMLLYLLSAISLI